MAQPDFKNIEELKNWIINIHEKYFVELKKPKSCRPLFGKHILHFAIHREGGFCLALLRVIR